MHVPVESKLSGGASGWQDARKFLSAFLKRPQAIGAIAPSSAVLARAMVHWIDWGRVSAVAEYGPGTGAFTGSILNAKRNDARYLALELDASMVQIMQRRFPDLAVHHASVARVRSICDAEKIDALDAIISGLPWAAFPDSLQEELLDATMEVLSPGGQFVTFAYLQGLLLPAGKRFRERIARYFAEVSTSPVVWRNLPPAIVYRCRRG